VRAAVHKLREGGIIASLFIDPEPHQIEAAHEVGAHQIELCTAEYADSTLGARHSHPESAARTSLELRRLHEAAALAAQYGLRIAAGHGLTFRNIGAVASIQEITEFNIGHNIISRSIFVGLDQAVREMREAIKAGI
jgi:pyridoxine 5-phosphate synthase